MSVRAATSSASTTTRPPTGTSVYRFASSMTGSGHSSPRQSSSRLILWGARSKRSETSTRLGRSHAHPGPDLADDLGEHPEEPLDVRLRRVAGQRDAEVAVREHSHRLEH